MTLTEKQIKEINDSLPSLSDSQWQEIFRSLRENVKPSSSTKFDVRKYSFEFASSYSGESDHYRYLQFINSILDAIRAGEEDYCFKVEHILDLLQFEHDRLKAEWLPDEDCFRVLV